MIYYYKLKIIETYGRYKIKNESIAEHSFYVGYNVLNICHKYGISDDTQILIGDINFDNVVNANDAALILDIYKYGK